MEFHKLANIFPLIEGGEFEQLVSDIREHGVLEPVWMLEGKILDGRNRYRAAQAAGVECPVRSYDGNDPIGFILSHNLKRRHLNESQRAMVAAKLVTLRDGQRQDRVRGTSIEVASRRLNVGRASVERAKAVQSGGAVELIGAVESGRVSVSVAADVASRPHEEQAKIVARGEREILNEARKIRAMKAAVRREQRMQKMIAACAGNKDLPTSQKYPIIYADPPWRHEHPPVGREVERHYPTMLLDEICALPVRELAADDAMLFLWVPAPKLAEAMHVIDAWGFVYRTCVIWDKELIGPGFYVRGQHELLLICCRGKFPTPADPNRPRSIYRERRGAHSVKPEHFAEMIERMYPALPKIELFARTARPGWSVWGNQVADGGSAVERPGREMGASAFQQISAA